MLLTILTAAEYFLKIRDDNKEIDNFLEKKVSCETVAKYVIVNKKRFKDLHFLFKLFQE